MAEYTGRKVAFSIARETTRGTAETIPDYTLNHMSLGFYPRAEKALNESALGVLARHNDSTTMHRWGEGDFELKAGDQSLGALLHAAMGSVSSGANADGSGNVYDHTFTMDESNSPASYTLFRKDPNVNEAFALGMITNFELNSELGSWLMLSGGFLSKAGATSTATPARITETEFKPKHMGIRLATNTAGLGAATDLATVQSFRLTIDRSVERDHTHGTDEPYDISVREYEINGEIVLRHTDQVYRDAFLADTQQAMRISIVNSDVTIGTAENPGLVITLPKVTFDNWEIDQGLGDKVNQTIGFKALYSTTDSSAISAVLTNLVTSYTA